MKYTCPTKVALTSAGFLLCFLACPILSIGLLIGVSLAIVWKKVPDNSIQDTLSSLGVHKVNKKK